MPENASSADLLHKILEVTKWALIRPAIVSDNQKRTMTKLLQAPINLIDKIVVN